MSAASQDAKINHFDEISASVSLARFASVSRSLRVLPNSRPSTSFHLVIATGSAA